MGSEIRCFLSKHVFSINTPRLLRSCLVTVFKRNYRNSLLAVSVPASRSLDSSSIMIQLRLAVRVGWDLPWSSLAAISMCRPLGCFQSALKCMDQNHLRLVCNGKIACCWQFVLTLNAHHWENLSNCFYFQHRFLTADELSKRDQAFFMMLCHWNSLFIFRTGVSWEELFLSFCVYWEKKIWNWLVFFFFL